VPDYMDDPEVYGVYRSYSRFTRANRATFSHRDSAARVAVVYSLPSMMFRRFLPLHIANDGDDDAFGRFYRTLDQLEAWHVPFDALVFGHPEFHDDAAALARLGRYEVLIFPAAEALTDAQAQALREFAQRGGKLIVAAAVGTRDQDYNPRETSAVAGLPTLDWGGDRARAALREAAGVEIEAPETVTVNIWRSIGGRSLDIHLVNYDADVAEEIVNPAGPFAIRVRLPEGFSPSAGRCLRPDEPPVEVEVTAAGGWAEIMVPSFGVYAIVCLGDPAVREQANQAAAARRQQDRAAVRAAAGR